MSNAVAQSIFDSPDGLNRMFADLSQSIAHTDFSAVLAGAANDLNIPQRVFIGMSEQTLDKLTERVADHILDQMKG